VRTNCRETWADRVTHGRTLPLRHAAPAERAAVPAVGDVSRQGCHAAHRPERPPSTGRILRQRFRHRSTGAGPKLTPPAKSNPGPLEWVGDETPAGPGPSCWLVAAIPANTACTSPKDVSKTAEQPRIVGNLRYHTRTLSGSDAVAKWRPSGRLRSTVFQAIQTHVLNLARQGRTLHELIGTKTIGFLYRRLSSQMFIDFSRRARHAERLH
jgi:hypothetical protein